jgi:PAS domain S-box-containing protein
MSSNTSELKKIINLHEVEQLRRSLIISIQNVQEDLFKVNTPLAHDLDLVVKEAVNLEKTASKCSACHHSPELAKRIDDVQSLTRDYTEALSYYITASANEQRTMKLKQEASQIGDRLIKLSGEMSHSASKSLEELTAVAVLRMNHVSKILLVTIVLTFLLGVMVAVILAKSVTKPVNELLNATRMISSGKLGSTINYKDETEFGELAEHFNAMSTAVRDGYDKLKHEVNERMQTEEALRESEARLQSVFTQMQDVFFRTERKGKIIWISPSAKEMLLHEPADSLIGHNISELFVSPKRSETFHTELSNNKRVDNFEAEFRRNDGSTFKVSINSHYFLDKNGLVEGIQGVCRDITEQKRLESEQLKIEKLESLGILAGGIAHDFNNILTAIIGNIKLLKITSDSSQDNRYVLSAAEDACKRAKDLTGQLLTFSKGGSPIKTITSLSQQLKDSALFALRGSNVKCEFNISSELWPVEIDEGQINQVIYNLVINANQAMPKGGVIQVSAENITAGSNTAIPLQGRNYIKITIKDEGEGIPPYYLQKIFDPYFTTKKQGSGLGLASSFSIIKNHSGYIDVESEPGKGSIFSLYMPAVLGKVEITDRFETASLKGDGKILLMDDDHSVRTTIGRTLEQLGYDVAIAGDGEEAINLYGKAKNSAKPFDALIMDLTIRDGLGGRETMEKLLELDPEVKAIVSSGYSTDPIMSDFRKYGFKGVIAKPYEIEDLNRLLNEIIDGRK